MKEGKSNLGQQTEVWFNRFFIQIDKIRKKFSYYRFTGHIFQILMFFMYLKIIYTLSNSADPDEMQHFVALHLDLHYLSQYSFRSRQWFNIHV